MSDEIEVPDREDAACEIDNLPAQLARIGWYEAASAVEGAARRIRLDDDEIARLTAERDDYKRRKDAAYLERNQVVAALAKCFPSGTAKTAIEGWSEDWHGCVYIDLPTGQVSWHYHDSHAHLFADLPPYAGSWDGHDTPEKYRRLASLKRDAAITRAEEAERLAVWAVRNGFDVDTSTQLCWWDDAKKKLIGVRWDGTDADILRALREAMGEA